MSHDPLESYLGLIQKDLRRIKSEVTTQTVRSLRLQRDTLGALVSRHQLWSRHAPLPELASLHTKLAASLQQVIDEYDAVLAAYENGSK